MPAVLSKWCLCLPLLLTATEGTLTIDRPMGSEAAESDDAVAGISPRYVAAPRLRRSREAPGTEPVRAAGPSPLPTFKPYHPQDCRSAFPKLPNGLNAPLLN